MAKFTDNESREWVLVIDPPSMKRVKELTGVNLGTTLTNEAELEELSKDIIAMVDVIFALVKPNADERGVSADSFGRALVGNPFLDAVEAFGQAVLDFCPSRPVRKLQPGTAETNQQPKNPKIATGTA